MPRDDLHELPDWPRGTVAILVTAGDHPHAIPISTAVRAGPRRIVLGLSRRRGTLERLKRDRRCALTVLAADDVAFTAHGQAAIEELPGEDRMVAISIEATSIQDHMKPDFRIDGGVQWRWSDEESAARDERVRAALDEL